MITNISRTIGTLSSFGARVTDGSKFIVPLTVALEGSTNGGVSYSAIALDEYFIAHYAGYLIQRTTDNDGNAVDWSSYNAYRVSYQVCNAGTFTSYTNQAITFATEADDQGNLVEFSPIGPDGQVLLAAVVDLIANRLILPVYLASVIAPYPPYAIIFGDVGYISTYRNVGGAIQYLYMQMLGYGGGTHTAAISLSSTSSQSVVNLSADIVQLRGTAIPEPRAVYIVSDYTTTDTNLSDITGLNFAILENEVWEFDIYLAVTQSGTGGIKLAVNGPSGASVVIREYGNTADVNTFLSNRNTSLNTGGATFATAAGFDGMVILHGVLTNGANAGDLRIRASRGTANGTARIYAKSYMTASRLA